MKNEKIKHKLPPSFLPDLKAAYEVEFTCHLPPEFSVDLKRVFETDPADDVSVEDLKRLEKDLTRWSQRCGSELKKELAKLPKNHPVKCPISLLEVKGYGRLEVAHTRTLAWLLNPQAEHGFKHALLEALLRQLHRIRGPLPFHVLNVTAEWYYKNSEQEDAGRTDIRIEGFWRNLPWLLIIEAKIDSSEGDQQLDRYDREIEEWQDAHKKFHEPDRIFLTPDGRPADGGKYKWTPLSFSSLVRVFWATANSLTADPGYHFLRYYLAGVLKNILDLPIGRDNGEQNRYKRLGFLKGT